MKNNKFKRELKHYCILVEGVKAHMPEFFRAYVRRINLQEKRRMFIKNKIIKKNNKKYINKEYIREMRELNIESSQSFNTIPMISKSQYVSLFIIFENSVRKFIKLSLSSNKDLLKLREKNVNLCDLLDFNNIREVLDFAIETEVNIALTNKKHIFEWIRSCFSINIPNINKTQDDFIIFNKIRNLIVHNNGTVNNFYIKSLKELNISKKDIPPKGSEINIEPKLFIKTARNLYLVGMQIGISLWLKTRPKDINILEDFIIEEQLKFLNKRNFKTVETISDIAIFSIKKFSSKNNKNTIFFNKAIAQKFKYKNNSYKNIIKDLNLSKKDNVYNLAIALINNDFKLASSIMLSFDKKILTYYFITWPLFTLNKKSRVLNQTFKKINGGNKLIEIK